MAGGAGLLSRSDRFVTVRDSDFIRIKTRWHSISQNSLLRQKNARSRNFAVSSCVTELIYRRGKIEFNLLNYQTSQTRSCYNFFKSSSPLTPTIFKASLILSAITNFNLPSLSSISASAKLNVWITPKPGQTLSVCIAVS